MTRQNMHIALVLILPRYINILLTNQLFQELTDAFVAIKKEVEYLDLVYNRDNHHPRLFWYEFEVIPGNDIGTLISATKESINRVFSKFKEKGQILYGISPSSATKEEASQLAYEALIRACKTAPSSLNSHGVDFTPIAGEMTEAQLEEAINNLETNRTPRICFEAQKKVTLIRRDQKWTSSVNENTTEFEILCVLIQRDENGHEKTFRYPLWGNAVRHSQFLQKQFDDALIDYVVKICKIQKFENSKFAINLYPDFFCESMRASLVDRLHSIKSMIQIEIVEGGNLSNEGAKAIAAMIRDGYQFAIDDFGTSNSNFDRLNCFCTSGNNDNRSLLKVDRQFLPNNKETPRIDFIRNFVDIASAAGFDLCFEGIEDNSFELQLDLIVQNLNFNALPFPNNVFLQGYKYGSPSVSVLAE